METDTRVMDVPLLILGWRKVMNGGDEGLSCRVVGFELWGALLFYPFLQTRVFSVGRNNRQHIFTILVFILLFFPSMVICPKYGHQITDGRSNNFQVRIPPSPKIFIRSYLQSNAH